MSGYLWAVISQRKRRDERVHASRRSPAFLAALVLAVSSFVHSASERNATRRVDFVREVQPILALRCYSCHGLKREEASLRLDQREAFWRGGNHGPLIVPGRSAASLLFAVIAGKHERIPTMPEGGERLTPQQIQLIREWIDQGAAWPESAGPTNSASEHWAFKPPVRPRFPNVKDKAWARNPIDQFILSRLERERLRPSVATDKVTLLRRLSLDLIGLPPTIAEVDAFLWDSSKDAYAKQVERLLASPHYGERWGRHWLDAARYADSDGFEKDKSRAVWFYRDWVVSAFNRDVPYDQFIIDQIAGDLLPNATQDQIVATGFLRNSMLNEEGGVDPEQFRMDGMFDRMDAIGKSILGLTIQCAQCHNHKFDPLTQRDYYRLFAFINNDHEAQRVVYAPDEQMKIAELTRQIREIEGDLQHRTPDWLQRMTKWEDEVSRNRPPWTVMPLEYVGENGQRYFYQKDDSVLAQGYAPTKFTASFRTTTKLTDISAFRLELLTDANLPCGGPGRSFKGTCALTEFTVDVSPANDTAKKTRVPIVSATSDYEQSEQELEKNFYDRSNNKRITGPVKFAIDGNANTAWGIDAGPGRRNQDRKAVFVPATKVGFDDGTIITFNLQQNHGGWNSDDHMNNNLGRFRISVTTSDGAIVADPLPKYVRDTLTIPRDQRTPAQQEAVFSYWGTTLPEWREVNARLEELWNQWPYGATQLVLQNRDEPRLTRMLKRGDWLKPEAAVTAGVPTFLHQLQPNPPTPFPNKEGGDSQRLDRLVFARWLADRRSPTTARSLVNRVWQAYFGNGLVNTSEDFGMQADRPSHPELLDWLACEFMDRGWKLKDLHRLIVNSATYRQSSRVIPQLYERDPQNRLLARGPRLRVEGEIVRDLALTASGLLNPKIGGPAIFSPIPYKLLPPISYGPFDWIEETGPDRYRRALYTFRRRSTPYPALQAFDAPNGDFSCVRRTRSNTPLQALTTLNETLFVEAAQALALRTLREGGATDRDRVVHAFRLCTSRAPTADEANELLGLLQRQMQKLTAAPVAATEQPLRLPPGVTPQQHAAWTVVARVVLNLDETITKE